MKYIFFFICLTLCSCNKEEVVSPPGKQVYVLFSPSGIGDMGYNDLILRGVLQAGKENDFRLYILSPTSMDEAGRLFRDWVQSENGDRFSSLFILAGNEYEEFAKELLAGEMDENKKVILFETRTTDINASTFSISMYGACYLAGCVASIFGEKAAVLCGSKSDNTVDEAATGFDNGFTESGGTSPRREYLADNWEGYAMPNAAYIKSAGFAQQCPFIFPLAGGSNLGVYRYTREYPDGIYTAGMDVDQSRLSTQVAFSVVKHIDLLLQDYIAKWFDDESIPDHCVYGIESGYIDVVLSPDYERACNGILQNNRDKAIKKEGEHEEDYL